MFYFTSVQMGLAVIFPLSRLKGGGERRKEEDYRDETPFFHFYIYIVVYIGTYYIPYTFFLHPVQILHITTSHTN